jgi:hypothetical protein
MTTSEKNAINMLNAQIELSSIIGEENEYLKLVQKRRQFWLSYLLDKKKIEKEIDYFDDDND